MKRGPKPANGTEGSQPDAKPGLVKKTFLFDKNVSLHLAVAALATGVEQSDIVRDATKSRLQQMGCDLSKPPRLPDIRPINDSVRAPRRRP